jgi:predicted ATPase
VREPLHEYLVCLADARQDVAVEGHTTTAVVAHPGSIRRQPLHLETLELTNFRAYPAASLTLPPTGLVLLAGANNSGKSALLSALDLVVRAASPTMARHAASSEPARVRARFALSEDERLPILAAVNDSSVVDGGAVTWLELMFVEAPDQVLHASELNAAWPGRSSMPLAKLNIEADGTRQLQINAAVSNLLLGQPLGGVVGQRPADPLVRWEDRVSGAVADLPDSLTSYAPQLNNFVELLGAWRQHYYHFGALRQGTAWTHALQSTPELDPTGSNLPAVLVDLQHNRPEAWERVREIIRRIVPEVGLLETRTDAQQVEVVFADPAVPGYRPNLKNLGTGVEQLLMTIVVGVTQPAPSIVVVEEPETNLHPGAQRALLALLREWSSDRLFIVSTHSSVFLDRSATTATTFLVEREQGRSTLRSLTKEPSEALSALGVQLSDVLTADRLLLVEGDPDREILTVWFPTLLSDPRVEVAIGHGGDNARFAGTLEEWLRALDRQYRRHVLYVRDRDELSTAHLDRLEKASTVHVLQRRELENYLLDADAVAAALVNRGIVDASTVDLQAVERALREGADRLKPVVVLKRVAAGLASHRLLDRALVAHLIRQGPTLEQLHVVLAERLPAEQFLEEVADQWMATEKDLQASWQERWRELAPGSDVLASVWRMYGRSYDKLNDGLAIARATEAPEELTGVIQRFLQG